MFYDLEYLFRKQTPGLKNLQNVQVTQLNSTLISETFSHHCHAAGDFYPTFFRIYCCRSNAPDLSLLTFQIKFCIILTKPKNKKNIIENYKVKTDEIIFKQ